MMDNMNWLITSILAEQRLREGLAAAARAQQLNEGTVPGGGTKRAVASALVRLGLRLDPAAGEGLGAAPLRHAEAGR
jgi:hypothetical protein